MPRHRIEIIEFRHKATPIIPEHEMEKHRAMSDYQKLHQAYMQGGMIADPPTDKHRLQKIEAEFGIPVYITDEQDRRLYELLGEIIREPWNQPKEGCHWLSGNGSKPSFSKADSAFLGKPVDPDAPTTGEPTFDDDVYYLESSARAFTSESERLDKMIQRRQDGDGRCAHCGKRVLTKDGLVPTHDFPMFCRSVCQGSKQQPAPASGEVGRVGKYTIHIPEPEIHVGWTVIQEEMRCVIGTFADRFDAEMFAEAKAEADADLLDSDDGAEEEEA